MNKDLSKIILVLGGISSGKSRFAEQLSEEKHQCFENCFYFTPAGEPRDSEMTEKVRVHKARRPAWLKTIECGIEPVKAFNDLPDQSLVMFDSAGTLLGRLLMENEGAATKRSQDLFIKLCRLCREKRCTLIFVSEEAGLTLVPLSESGRTFQKTLGVLNQFLAEEADDVYFIIAGLPQRLK